MEKWRDVPGYEGLYQISIITKEGKCRSLNYRGHKGVVKEFKTKPNKNNYNRIYWNLTADGKATVQQAAVWIALTYPELVKNEYFEGAVIDHIDTDPLNNHPSNLRWVTSKENSNNPLTRKHLSEGHKGYTPTEDTKINMRKASPRNKSVKQLSLNGDVVATYISIREAARQTGIPNASIYSVCEHKPYYHTAGGFKWEYLNS